MNSSVTFYCCHLYIQIAEQNYTTSVKAEEQAEQELFEETLSEEHLSPSLVADDEHIHESRDLLLKLEVDEAFIDDINDKKDDTDDTDIQCGNEDEASNEDKDVRPGVNDEF